MISLVSSSNIFVTPSPLPLVTLLNSSHLILPLPLRFLFNPVPTSSPPSISRFFSFSLPSPLRSPSLPLRAARFLQSIHSFSSLLPFLSFPFLHHSSRGVDMYVSPSHTRVFTLLSPLSPSLLRSIISLPLPSPPSANVSPSNRPPYRIRIRRERGWRGGGGWKGTRRFHAHRSRWMEFRTEREREGRRRKRTGGGWMAKSEGEEGGMGG